MSLTDLVTMYRDKRGTPIQFWHWVALCENEAYRTVAREDLYGDGGVIVSTIWMGMHEKQFESLAFRGKARNVVDQRRYETEAEALAGHAEIVAQFRGSIPRMPRRARAGRHAR